MYSESIVSWWVQLVRRRWVAGALIFAVPAALGVAILSISKPVYRADARVRLGEPPPMGGVSPNSGVLGFLRMGGDPFSNDLELLASRTLAEGVVEDVGLNSRLTAPAGWYRDSFFVSVQVDRTTRKRKYQLEWTEGGVQVSTDSGRIAVLTPGAPGTFGGITAVARPWRAPMPRTITLSTIPFGEAVRTTQSKLKFERARRDANVVLINYQSPDPAIAHAAVDRALQHFIDLRTTLLRRESSITVDSVRGVAERTRVELGAAERALESVQRTTGLISPQAQGELAVTQFADVSARLELARLELRTLTAARERADPDGAAAAWTSLLAYPRFLNNAAMKEIVGALNDMENQRRDLSRRRTADNLDLQIVLDRIKYMDESLRTLAADYSKALVGEVASLEAQEQQMRRDFTGMPAQIMELVRRQRDARVLGEIVVLAEQRLRQEELRQAMTFANVQVIDPPALRYRPVWPRKKLGMLVTLMLASGTALLGMVVVDRADGAVRSARALREVISAPVLAAVVLDRKPPHVMDADAVRALLRHGVAETSGVVTLAVADCADGSHARVCADSITNGVSLSGDAMMPAAVVEVLPSIRNYAAASAAAAARLPLILVVEAGATDMVAAARAAELLREAGAEIAGAVVLCRDQRAAKALWL